MSVLLRRAEGHTGWNRVPAGAPGRGLPGGRAWLGTGVGDKVSSVARARGGHVPADGGLVPREAGAWAGCAGGALGLHGLCLAGTECAAFPGARCLWLLLTNLHFNRFLLKQRGWF